MGDGRLLAACYHHRPHRTCEGPTRVCTATSRCVRHDVGNAAVSCWSSAFTPLPLTADDCPHCLVRTLHRKMRQTALVAPGCCRSPLIDQADAEEQGKSTRRGTPLPTCWRSQHA